MKIFNRTKEKVDYFISIILMIMLGYGILEESNIVLIFSLFFLAYLLISNTFENSIYFFIVLIPFASGVEIFDKNILFIFVLIVFSKLIFNKNKKFNISEFALMLSLLLIEIVLDFSNTKIGVFAYIITSLFYFLFYIIFADLKSLNRNKLALYLVSTLFIAICLVVYISGGVNDLEQINSFDRLGDKARDLGGAMGVPIYCLIIISINLNYIVKNHIKLLTKLLFFAIIVLCFFIGFYTVSKVYILGLGIIGLSLFFALFTKDKKNVAVINLLIGIAIIISFFVYYDFFLNLIEQYVFRLSGDISTGRFKIFSDCFLYLKENPLALLFGSGAYNYIKIGKDNGYMFSMSAHNLILDGIMAWGIIGFSILLIFCLLLFKKLKKSFLTKFNILNFMPLIVYLFCSMTGGSFNEFKIYMYLLSLIIFSLMEVENENRHNITKLFS